ncbi:UvrD-helicase domain-containing protein [Brevibacillus laterosporus]|uniref:UvrD-helicase domain-containing protein n=1 Tax=Brevibacillus laterosporus TaxID=1465 RepID=UPI0034E02C16
MQNQHQSKDIQACPGSGKTTTLLAKLTILSRKLPLKSNKGICVLTHTNVAVDEIRKRLGGRADVFFDILIILVRSNRLLISFWLSLHTSKCLENVQYASIMIYIMNTLKDELNSFLMVLLNILREVEYLSMHFVLI